VHTEVGEEFSKPAWTLLTGYLSMIRTRWKSQKRLDEFTCKLSFNINYAQKAASHLTFVLPNTTIRTYLRKSL